MYMHETKIAKNSWEMIQTNDFVVQLMQGDNVQLIS